MILGWQRPHILVENVSRDHTSAWNNDVYIFIYILTTLFQSSNIRMDLEEVGIKQAIWLIRLRIGITGGPL
jgi:hypothetical protein